MGFINSLHISLKFENITVLGPVQVLDERILLIFIIMMYSLPVLYKEAKSWFYILKTWYIPIYHIYE